MPVRVRACVFYLRGLAFPLVPRIRCGMAGTARSSPHSCFLMYVILIHTSHSPPTHTHTHTVDKCNIYISLTIERLVIPFTFLVWELFPVSTPYLLVTVSLLRTRNKPERRSSFEHQPCRSTNASSAKSSPCSTQYQSFLGGKLCVCVLSLSASAADTAQ